MYSISIWRWNGRGSVLEDQHLRAEAWYYIYPAIENLLKVCFQNSVQKELTLRCTKGIRKIWKLVKDCLSSLMCIIGNFAFSFSNLYLLHLHSRAPSCTLTANFNLLMQFIQLLYCFYFWAIWRPVIWTLRIYTCLPRRLQRCAMFDKR